MSNPIVTSINDELLAELESELGQVLRIAEFAGGVDQLSAVGIGSYLRLVTPQKVLSLLASNRALLAHIVELKRDAERYRLLAAMAVADCTGAEMTAQQSALFNTLNILCHLNSTAELDAAFDNALEAAP